MHAFEFVPAREYAGVALRLRSRAEFATQGQRVLDEQMDRIRQMGGEVADVRLCVGSPVDQILCWAEETEADEGVDGVAVTILEEAAGSGVPSLISVGRRGLGAVQRARVGSV